MQGRAPRSSQLNLCMLQVSSYTKTAWRNPKPDGLSVCWTCQTWRLHPWWGSLAHDADQSTLPICFKLSYCCNQRIEILCTCGQPANHWQATTPAGDLRIQGYNDHEIKIIIQVREHNCDISIMLIFYNLQVSSYTWALPWVSFYGRQRPPRLACSFLQTRLGCHQWPDDSVIKEELQMKGV